MIYRAAYYREGGALDEHEGYGYFGSKSAALREIARRRNQDGRGAAKLLDGVKTPKTKAEIIRLLNRWGSHADNG